MRSRWRWSFPAAVSSRWWGRSRPTMPAPTRRLLKIDEVLRWKRRPRVTLDVPATVVLVQGAAASERSAPVAVRVLDLAPQGVAFAAPEGFRRGDRLRLGTTVGERQLLVEPRVLQVGRPVFGRCRVSCTFAADPAVELVLAELADRAA